MGVNMNDLEKQTLQNQIDQLVEFQREAWEPQAAFNKAQAEFNEKFSLYVDIFDETVRAQNRRIERLERLLAPKIAEKV